MCKLLKKTCASTTATATATTASHKNKVNNDRPYVKKYGNFFSVLIETADKGNTQLKMCVLAYKNESHTGYVNVKYWIKGFYK